MGKGAGGRLVANATSASAIFLFRPITFGEMELRRDWRLGAGGFGFTYNALTKGSGTHPPLSASA